MSPDSAGHLFKRFLDVASARALDATERSTVDGWLSRPLAELFFDQPDPDQRHGYEAALSVVDQGYTDPNVISAALLHDVGKRHARLGLIGRSFASVAILAGLPLSARMTTYRDHGMIAAAELGRAGASSLAVDFALHHHDRRPATIPSDVWEVLVTADQPPKMFGRQSGLLSRLKTAVLDWIDARKRREPPITSDIT